MAGIRNYLPELSIDRPEIDLAITQEKEREGERFETPTGSSEFVVVE